MPRIADCLSSGDLKMLLLGTLPAERAAAAEEHLSSCVACQRAAATADDDDLFVAALRSAVDFDLPENPSVRLVAAKARESWLPPSDTATTNVSPGNRAAETIHRPAAEPTATPAAASRSSDNRRPPLRLLIAAGAAGLLLLLWGVIVIIRNREGQEVGRLESATGTSVEVQTTNSTLPLPKPSPSSTQGTATQPLVGQPVVVPDDRDQPFVVVRADTGEQVECGTPARALEVHRDGDVIEVHGNGPFLVSGLSVKQKTLILRAAPGYRPVFRGVFPTRQAFLMLDDVRLTVEGCDFRVMVMNHNQFFVGSGPAWEFKSCRFLTSGGFGQIFTYTGERLAVTDSLISLAGGHWLNLSGPKGVLEISNSIVRVGGIALLPVVDGGDWKIQLTQNTFVTSATLFPQVDKVIGKVEVQAHGNIFQLNETNGNAIQVASYDTWKDKVRWDGSDNLYVGAKEGLAAWHDKQGKQRSYGLAGWALFAGRKETNAAEATAFFPAWREPYSAQSPTHIVAAFKRLTTDRGHIAAGVTVGPDWNLVGPGDAYLRSLAARGKTVSSDQLRPRPYEGGAFVLFRGGKPIKGFDQLSQAFEAAENGDLIEIRTDDETPGFRFKNSKRIASLTVRAAPGYLPTIVGGVGWIVNGLELGVEGIHFRGGVFNIGGGLQGGNRNRLVSLTNCSISGPAAASWGNATAVYDDAAEAATDGTCLIENCAISECLQLTLTPGSQLIVRNSAVGAIHFRSAGGDDQTPRVELDRSVLFYPGTYTSPGSLMATSGLGATQSSAVAFRVNHCWLESTGTLLSCGGSGFAPASWTGSSNVYCAGEQSWYSIYAGRTPTISRGLADWKAAWGSDADSVELDPGLYDPRLWKLLSGTPGYQQGPDGNDLGADVSRIAATVPQPTK